MDGKASEPRSPSGLMGWLNSLKKLNHGWRGEARMKRIGGLVGDAFDLKSRMFKIEHIHSRTDHDFSELFVVDEYGISIQQPPFIHKHPCPSVPIRG